MKLQMVGRYYVVDWVKQNRPELNVTGISITGIYHIKFMCDKFVVDDDVFIDVAHDGTLCCNFVNRPGGCIITPDMITENDIILKPVRFGQIIESY